MARAIVETDAQNGIIRLAAHANFFPQLEDMFPAREQLPIGGMTTGETETCLDCINCMLHHVMDRVGRPAPVNAEKIAELEKLFNELPPEHLALYLLCPQLKKFSPRAGNFPCQTKGLMPIANT